MNNEWLWLNKVKILRSERLSFFLWYLTASFVFAGLSGSEPGNVPLTT